MSELHVSFGARDLGPVLNKVRHDFQGQGGGITA
jgi:hypothetical protein